MATIVQSHERECAVCTNDFNTPKILPCGHLLCRECLISWMDSKSDASCPLCTCPIVEHQGNLSQSSADVVDALPTDYVMEAIVESARVLVKDDICTVCDDVKSEYICMQCLEKSCQSCMKIHKKMAVSRSHDVESLSAVTPERLAASRPALCADHGDKKAEFFCVSHNLVVCASCISNKHNECPSVKHMDNKVKSAEKAIFSLTEELAKAEDNLKQTIRNLNDSIKTWDATEQENMGLVDKTCDRLHKMVEECRKQLKELISDSISKFENSLCDVKRELEIRLGKVTSHKHLVTRATTVRPCTALIPAAQTLTDRVHNLNFSDKLEAEPWVDPSPKIAKYCDDVGKRIKAELQRMEQQRIEPKAAVLVFHENCGGYITLRNGRTTAKMNKEDILESGVVVSRDAMAVNVLYEVRIDEVHRNNGVFLGVTEIPPEQLDFMSSLFEEESIIIGPKYVMKKWRPIDSEIGKVLKYIKVGSHVGVLVDSSSDLHLYVDGHDQGVAAKEVGQPCFAAFLLDFNITQVTALPTSRRI